MDRKLSPTASRINVCRLDLRHRAINTNAFLLNLSLFFFCLLLYYYIILTYSKCTQHTLVLIIFTEPASERGVKLADRSLRPISVTVERSVSHLADKSILYEH